LYVVYFFWNSFLYILMRNRLGDLPTLYARCPQNWDELIWPRLFFLDGQLLLLTKTNRQAGLAAIDAVAASFRQGWAAQRAGQRLLLLEMSQVQNISELAAIRETVAWLPVIGPQPFWNALDRITRELNAALRASSQFNRLTRLNRVQGMLRQMQTALPNYQTTTDTNTPDSVDMGQLVDLLQESFNEDELRTLTFDLGIDYEELAGENKDVKVRELIAYAERRNRTAELIDVAANMRPQAGFNTLQLQQATSVIPFYAVTTFRPILNQWIQLIDDEIVHLTRAREESSDIENPFIPGQPIQPDGQTVFRGRQDIFAEIENSLTALHQQPTLLLHGPRRSGKTSLLLQLPRQLPENIVPVFINLQEVADTVYSVSGFVVALAEAVRRQSRENRGLTLPSVRAVDFEKEPYLAFSRWLDDTERPLIDYTLFITFDEFEWVEKAIDQGRLEENVLSFFRNLIQRVNKPRPALLFSGLRLLDEMKYNWPSYFINVKTVKVGYLPEKDALGLITRPVDDFPLDYEPEALTLYLHQTRCQPYLIQLVGFELVNYLNSAERRAKVDPLNVLPADIEVGFEKGLAAGYNYFAEIWNSSNAKERLILADLAVGHPLPPELSEGEQLRAVRHLIRRDLVEKSGDGYQIQVPLVACWIREEKPPNEVRAEIEL